MRKGLVLLLSIFSTMELFSQSKPIDRQPAVAGRFYTADKECPEKRYLQSSLLNVKRPA